MAKDKLNQASAERTTRREKPVTVEYHVELALLMLSPEERETIQNAIRSWTQLRKLERTADFIGPDDTRRIAEVSENMRIVFRVSDDGAEVIDIINKRIPIETRPARRVKKRRRPKNDPKV